MFDRDRWAVINVPPIRDFIIVFRCFRRIVHVVALLGLLPTFRRNKPSRHKGWHQRKTDILAFCAQQHAEQIARIVGVGDHVELIKERCAFDCVMDVAQRTEVFDRKTDAIKQGNFAR